MLSSLLSDRLKLQKLKDENPELSYTDLLAQMGENLKSNRPKLIPWYKTWKALGGEFTEDEQNKLIEERERTAQVAKNEKIENELYYTTEFPREYRSKLEEELQGLKGKIEDLEKDVPSDSGDLKANVQAIQGLVTSRLDNFSTIIKPEQDALLRAGEQKVELKSKD